LARSFYLLENVAHNISEENLLEVISEYKKKQRIKDNFYTSKIFILFPEDKQLISGLETQENEICQSCYFEIPEQISVPYEISGGQRSMDFVVIKLTRLQHGRIKKRDYFLCVDNRPLNNLADLPDFQGLSTGQVYSQCRAYYRDLSQMIKNDDICAQRFHVLAFQGNLSAALEQFCQQCV